ncbi:MAG: hypothetical protein M1829_003208 [Trizodia sp. TS-e1964]|nr:MAG: hypothetical protein M1829_003208 [Trizodia sp. TS-e1964]
MGPLPSDSDSAAVHVLVTGFAPFSSPFNPSSALLPLLPTQLPSTPTSPPITIHTAAPIKVSYPAVLTAVPELFKHDTLPRLVLHIGMNRAAEKYSFSLETHARRDFYYAPDVDNETLPGGCVDEWAKRPEELPTGIETFDVIGRCKELLLKGGASDANVTLALSDDAGRYLCEFLLYADLSFWWASRATEAPTVLFLHIPGDAEQSDLERDARVVVALLRSVVESGLLERRATSESSNLQQ